MVYVSRDGTVHDKQPWGLDKIMSIMSGVLNMIVAFFQTMLPIENSEPTNPFRNSGGRSTGGGSGGGGGPRGPPGPPRPGSNIRGFGPTTDAPPSCGSCCGR